MMTLPSWPGLTCETAFCVVEHFMVVGAGIHKHCAPARVGGVQVVVAPLSF